MRAVVFFFLILVSNALATDNGFLPQLEVKFQDLVNEYVGYIASWFQSFNDENLGKTEMGRLLHYDEMKRKLVVIENLHRGRKKVMGRQSVNYAENDRQPQLYEVEERRMKKHGAAMIPLVFQVGAASTWMLLTTLLTAKSLAVGLALLVFKIAAGSAKLASFFTQLKHGKEDHHEWSPHYEHHGHHDHVPEQHGTITHTPSWTPIAPHYDYKNHFHTTQNEFHGTQNEFHDTQNELHDTQNDEFHDTQNEYTNYVTQGYKTISAHDALGSDLEGAKKLDRK